jgi:hypothetical protein
MKGKAVRPREGLQNLWSFGLAQCVTLRRVALIQPHVRGPQQALVVRRDSHGFMGPTELGQSVAFHGRPNRCCLLSPASTSEYKESASGSYYAMAVIDSAEAVARGPKTGPDSIHP